VDPRADIYALGATLVLPHRRPPAVPDDRPAAETRGQTGRRPAAPRRPAAGRAAGFAAVVQRLMARDPIGAVPGAGRGRRRPAPVGGNDRRLPRPALPAVVGQHRARRRATDHEPDRDPLPDTLCIIKPSGRRPGEPADGPVAPLPPAPEREFAEQGTDTQAVGGEAALTDEMRAAPADRADLSAGLWGTPPPVAVPAGAAWAAPADRSAGAARPGRNFPVTLPSD